MRTRARQYAFRAVALLLATLTVLTATPLARAASHREAPLISLDPPADITDVYFFRSWEDPNTIVAIMNVIPSQVPAAGPNFYNFDDQVVYALNFDLDKDGVSDVRVEFRFTTEVRPPFGDLPVPLAGVDPAPPLPPAITALDGPGSEGLGSRQRYTVRVVAEATGQVLFQTAADQNGKPLIAVPSNVGARTMPGYSALAAQGVFTLGGGLRVFAGQRKETFYIDLASTFDTLNFRRNPPVLTDAEDADNTTNPFGLDDFAALNVNTIAFEFPRSVLPQPVVGLYASTSRGGVQVSRMANPLVNEVLIGTGSKDLWNATEPEQEAQFLNFYQFPRLALLLNLAFGIAIPPTPRNDLALALLQYSTGGAISELLRLDTSVAPTAPASQKRLGPLGHDAAGLATPDPAGWPNGRRPNDDITDIAVRVVAGVLSGNACCTGAPHNRLGDGVNVTSVPVATPGLSAGNNVKLTFPFLPDPIPGRS
jgi:Domain of unknown function (DUF4331)